MSEIKLVRIYNHEQEKGFRILVDRLWPRGISKVKADLDLWAKEIGPSNNLRKWFNHDPEKFAEFKTKYLAEIKANSETKSFVELVSEKLKKGDVIFLYGAKDPFHNQAVILKEYFTSLLK
ncbi:DUF488 family protein [Lactobacillus mulieris]|uniref:DUF488 domain-containing protein n=1 Tax=Lactobacillus mulieris TaxID=2508708 RepID=UPI0022CD628D|nr:DUF488 family protein [Lactobacillus mulieris]MCZ9647462.1 DUF488 family protein [Lactobacillus mulieris]